MKIRITHDTICTGCGKMKEEEFGLHVATDGRRLNKLEIFLCKFCIIDAFLKILKKEKRKKSK